MQPFVLLSAVFAALVALFEYRPVAEPASAMQRPVAKVVRDLDAHQPVAQPLTEPAAPKPTVKNNTIAKRSPLNLNLQLPAATLQPAPAARSSRLDNLFDYQGREKVSYSAELVFDHARGEEITGGKVNIKIPLS